MASRIHPVYAGRGRAFSGGETRPYATLGLPVLPKVRVKAIMPPA